MSLEIYVAFVLASIVILIIPGPTIILVVSQAMVRGKASVMPLALGVMGGDLTSMTLSLLGVGTIMSACATLFVLFKWLGALYLICLGIRMWRAQPQPISEPKQPKSRQSLFRSAFIVTALNPKSIAFFVAFFPQFINPRESLVHQLLLLGCTFLALALTNAALYGYFASRLGRIIQTSRAHRWFQRCGGTALISAGIVTAGMERSS